MKRVICFLRGHRWREQKPHRMWDLNLFTCSRCGAYEWKGIIT